MLFQYKVVCIGQSGVGKTSILGRCRESNFHLSSPPTILMDFISFKFEINSETVKLHIWDTAGQQKFASINQVYYHNSLGAILVVSAEKYLSEINETMESMERFLQKYTQFCKNQNIFLIFNKIDLIDFPLLQEEYKLHQEKMILLKKKFDIQSVHFLSAKTSKTSEIKSVLEMIINKLVQQNEQRQKQPESMFLTREDFANKPKQGSQKKKCCQ